MRKTRADRRVAFSFLGSEITPRLLIHSKLKLYDTLKPSLISTSAHTSDLRSIYCLNKLHRVCMHRINLSTGIHQAFQQQMTFQTRFLHQISFRPHRNPSFHLYAFKMRTLQEPNSIDIPNNYKRPYVAHILLNLNLHSRRNIAARSVSPI